MRRILLLLVALGTFAFGASAQTALQVDYIQAVYTSSYDGTIGNWTFTIANGNTLVATIDVNAASTKRLARDYKCADQSIISGNIYCNGESALTDGEFTLSYVEKGTRHPIYHIAGTLTDAQENAYTLDSDVELYAYDYACYVYYEMGLLSLEDCTVILQDAPDEETGVVYECPFVGGNWEDYTEDMCVLKVTAEDTEGHYTQLLFDADGIATGSYIISDYYASLCYIANMETQTYDVVFKSGTATITVHDNGCMSIDGRFKDRITGDAYHITIPVVAPAGEDYHNYTTGIVAPLAAPVEQPTKRISDGQIIISSPRGRYDIYGRLAK